MIIKKSMEDKLLTVKLSGRLDTISARELDAELAEILKDADKLVFDLDEREYMSSAGLRVFIATQKYMYEKGGMKVRNINEVTAEIFDITGFSKILDIE